MQKLDDGPIVSPKTQPAKAQRVLIATPPSYEKGGVAPWVRGTWPCRWIGCAGAEVPPYIVAFKNRFTVEISVAVRLHVSADERYVLFLDGERIGRGSERGDAEHWFFETYDLWLPAGSHTLVAWVWALGELAPMAQISLTPGFYAMPEDRCFLPLLGTGHAPWEAKVLGGYSFHGPLSAWGTGARADIRLVRCCQCSDTSAPGTFSAGTRERLPSVQPAMPIARLLSQDYGGPVGFRAC